MRGLLAGMTATALAIAAAGLGYSPRAASANQKPRVQSEVIFGQGVEVPKSRARSGEALRDIREAAHTDGIPEAVLVARAEKSPQLEAVTERTQELYPDSFTGSGLSREGREQPWIAFKDEVPAQVKEWLVALPFDVEAITGTGVAATEIEAAVAATLPSVTQAYSAESASAGLDLSTFGIAYHLQGGSHAGDAQPLSQALEETTRRYAPEVGELKVVRENAGPLELMTTVQGGRPLTVGPQLECTAGFTAVRNGNAGVLTAKHCANDVNYNFEPNVLTFGAGASDAPNGMIDLQFNRTLAPHSTNSQFRATGRTSADDRTVTQVANPTVGGIVCKWGEVTGYNCTTVQGVDFCVVFDYDIHARCGLASTVSPIIAPGDSGGPWFFASTARGTTTGGNNSTSYFTQIGRAKTYLDASVLQQ